MRKLLLLAVSGASLVGATARAGSPLSDLDCDIAADWLAAGAEPIVRTLANHQGWSAFEATRGKEHVYVLAHPADDGSAEVTPWEGLDAPAEGACYLFRKTLKVKAPRAGSFGPKGGTQSVRLMLDDACGDESCAHLVLGVGADGLATSAVVLTTPVVGMERLQVFGAHDSLLIRAETDAGAGYRHAMRAVLHDFGTGLQPLLSAEIGVHEALSPSERRENPTLRCWREPAGWIRVERAGAAPVLDVLTPKLASEDGEGSGMGEQVRWEWSPEKGRLVQSKTSAVAYDARAACRKGGKGR